MLGRKKAEGRPIKEKAEDKIWRSEFEQMSLKEHAAKLAQLGLDDEDIEEFNGKFAGKAEKKGKK